MAKFDKFKYYFEHKDDYSPASSERVITIGNKDTDGRNVSYTLGESYLAQMFYWRYVRPFGYDFLYSYIRERNPKTQQEMEHIVSLCKIYERDCQEEFAAMCDELGEFPRVNALQRYIPFNWENISVIEKDDSFVTNMALLIIFDGYGTDDLNGERIKTLLSKIRSGLGVDYKTVNAIERHVIQFCKTLYGDEAANAVSDGIRAVQLEGVPVDGDFILSWKYVDFTDGKLFQLFNTDYNPAFEPFFFDSSEIFPGLEAVMSKNVPLVFFSLNYIENPMGYVCFHYNNFDLANYAKMPQTVHCINTALGSYRNIRCQHYLNERIEEMYKSDALTGLYNRNGFIKEYDKLIQVAKDGLTVVLADLDGLKSINDGYGHGEGDIAIHEVAIALKACCPEDAICARFGGDEMMAVIKGRYTEDIRGEIRKYLDSFNSSSGKPYRVSASVGIYHASYDEIDDFEEILRQSDKLMYMDKENKR